MGIDTAIRKVESALNEAKEALGERRANGAAIVTTRRRSMRRDLEDGLMDAGGAATFLNLSVSWVYKAAERGELPCLRIGSALRFEPEALRAWVKQRANRQARLSQRRMSEPSSSVDGEGLE